MAYVSSKQGVKSGTLSLENGPYHVILLILLPTQERNMKETTQPSAFLHITDQGEPSRIV